MEAVLPRASWLSLLEHVADVTDPKSPYAPARQVYLEASRTHLTARGTDLCRSYEGQRALTAGKPGSACLDARLFRDTLKAFPEGEVVVSVAGSVATVTHLTAKRRSKIPAGPGEDYPAWPEIEGAPVAIQAAVLHELIRFTHYAQSNDSARPHMAATMFAWHGEELRAVATNGHQLSTALAKAPNGLADTLVPSVAVALLKSLPESGEVKIALTSKHATWEITSDRGRDHWRTKTIDAQFPSWKQVLPESYDGKVTVQRATLLEALTAVSAMTKDRTNSVKLSPGRGELHLHSAHPEVGEMEDTIAADVEGHVPAAFGINAAYCRAVLGGMVGEKVEIRLTGELDPVVFVDPTIGDRGAAVIMPMML